MHAKRLALAMLVLALTASCGSTRSVVKAPTLEPPPGALIYDCNRPVVLPDGPMTVGDVETYWLADREALVECGVSKKALRDYYARRDSAITQ